MRRHGYDAATAEFHPGFRNSVAAYTVSLLQAKVIHDLRFAEHGLRIPERPMSNFLPPGEQQHLCIGPDLATTRREMEARRELLSLFTKSAADLLDHWFESDGIKAAYGFDAVVGSYAGPQHPGTAYVLLHHQLGEVNGQRGRHVASLFCQHFDPQADWPARREEAVQRIFAVVETHAPGLRARVLAHSALSPWDLEQQFGLLGGDISHGVMSLDQLWAARPLLGLAAYRSPIPGLYHCGAGSHLGGGASGAPGHNCAREMLRDMGRRCG